jgi:uncharacterized membrane protein YgcG
MRDWAVKRRERTRHLIELGGLVVKAGLVELSGNDRALLYGAFLHLADALRSETREQMIALWRIRGSRTLRSGTSAWPSIFIGSGKSGGSGGGRQHW